MPDIGCADLSTFNDASGTERVHLEALLLESAKLLEDRDQHIKKLARKVESLEAEAKIKQQVDKQEKFSEQTALVESLRSALVSKERARFMLEVEHYEMLQSGRFECSVYEGQQGLMATEIGVKIDAKLGAITKKVSDLSRMFMGPGPTKGVPFETLASEARRRAYLTQQILNGQILLEGDKI
jgi:hypothetical protein